jgi:hypothetical protein
MLLAVIQAYLLRGLLGSLSELHSFSFVTSTPQPSYTHPTTALNATTGDTTRHTRTPLALCSYIWLAYEACHNSCLACTALVARACVHDGPHAIISGLTAPAAPMREAILRQLQYTPRFE